MFKISWLSSDWFYRKKITITGQTGAGTDYQVLLKIGETSGAVGEDFDLENHSLIFPSDKNEGGDLRFTADNGITLLDFWVEKVTGTTPNRLAYVWVEVSADLGSNQDIYCYYGNAGASNYSNGDDTFPFFDDFPGSSLDSSKWDTIGTPSIGVTNSILTIETNAVERIESKTYSTSRPIALRAYGKKYDIDGDQRPGEFGFGVYTSPVTTSCVVKGTYTTNQFTLLVSNGTSNTYFTGITDDLNWHSWDITWTSLAAQLFRDDSQQNGDITTYIPSASLKVTIGKYHADANKQDVDFIFTRKFLATEPAFSSADSEEELPSAILADTIYLSDAFNYPEAILSDTITLSDSIVVDIAHYVTRITKLDANNMLIVTDTDPAEIIKVDISGGTPVFRIHPLLTAKNALDVTVNSTFDKIYVACADGKVVKLASADLTDKTLLDTEDTDDLISIDCLDAHYFTYAGTDDSEGEIILIDESEITKLNSDIRFLIQTETIINSQINTIKASIIDSDIRFLRTTSTIVNSDIRFAKYAYSEETPIARTDFHVFINGVETGDVALDSIRVVRADEQKDMAYFSVARKHDDLDRTLGAVASQITNQNAVIVKIEDRTIFTGTIKEIQCYSTEKVDVTAESADVGTVDFSTVNLGLQDTSHQIHLYDVILDDINIENPTIDPTDENPRHYKGVTVDLGTETTQNNVKNYRTSSGITATTIDLARYIIMGIEAVDEINEGTFEPEPEWTYFWTVTGEKLLDTGYWDELERNEPYFSPRKPGGENFKCYVGISLSSVSDAIFKLTSAKYVRQQEFPTRTTELGAYTLGDAPYKTVSSKNGRSKPYWKWVDDETGWWSVYPAWYDYVEYAKEVAAIEFAKMKTINDEILPITRANINLTVDAFLYYAIQLNTRINLDNTTVAGTYKNNNGFPVSVKGIEINSRSMQVQLICDNEKSKYELDALDATMPDEDDPKYGRETDLWYLQAMKCDPSDATRIISTIFVYQVERDAT